MLKPPSPRDLLLRRHAQQRTRQLGARSTPVRAITKGATIKDVIARTGDPRRFKRPYKPKGY